MSQVQRQDSGHNGDHRPQSPYLNKSSARGRTSPPSPLSNTLIPRDYLGQRPDAQKQRTTVTGTPRKPNPSPLHSSHLPQSPPEVTNVPEMPAKSHPYSSRLLYDNGPIEYNSQPSQGASGDTAHRPEGPSPDSAATSGGPVHPQVVVPSGQDITSTKAQTYDQIRNALTSITSLPPTRSPPVSPTTTTSSGATERPDPPVMPRTSSIDSAISSISSSASHSHKSSLDSNAPNTADISNLIAAAGSPEAVILHLLKEKQHAASQNAQLWRLVDKQRTLVFGLNKDLERALKDKEKYRKKLKEIQNHAPPLPSMTPQTALGPSRADSESPAPSESLERVAQVSKDRDLANGDMNVTPKKRPDLNLGSSPIDSALVPAPLHLLEQQHAQSQVDAATNGRMSPTEAKAATKPSQPAATITNGHNQFSDNPPSILNSTTRDVPPDAPLRPLPEMQSSLNPPSLALIEPSPLNEKPEKTFPPVRKAPPAPLNLNQPKKASAHLHQLGPDDNSESEYDDILEVDEIPAFDRGRKKTREADDREREAAAIREQKARSRSKKKRSSKGEKAPENKVVQASDLPVTGLPTSPKQMVPLSPPTGIAGRLSPPNSLVSMISANSSEAPSLGERLSASPPMSPGLPLSPRPMDRPLGSPLPRNPREGLGNVASPPLSPRNGMPGLPLSPRAPKHPIPLPPHTPLSLASPPLAQVNPPILSPRQGGFPQLVIPTITGDIENNQTTSPTSPPQSEKRREVYQGLIDEEYPELLLPPNALPSVDVKVSSSRLRPSRHSYMAPQKDEEPVFTLSIFSRSDRSELWRVEKVVLSLPQLDQQVKSVSRFSAKLPDRSLFSGHSPAKVDARRAALNTYFEILLDTPMDENAALVVCHFLSTDAIEPRDDETSLFGGASRSKPILALGPDGRPRKEGYLTKRGKNFGGWKARFFTIQGPELKYYESPGGPQLGNIKLQNAQIGKQSQPNASPSRSEDDIENQYRHAFLILEPKKKDSTSLVRHVLCAESDRERDEWVEALLRYVDYQSEDERPKVNSIRSESGHSHITGFNAKLKRYETSMVNAAKEADSPDSDQPDALQGLSYENTVAAEAPVRGRPSDRGKDGTPSPTSTTSAPNTNQSNLANHGVHPNHAMHEQMLPPSQSAKSISGPTNGAPIQDAGLWGNKPATVAKEKEHKKRSIWGFRQRSESDLIMQNQAHNDSNTSLSQNHSTERKGSVRAVFGLSLAEAVEYCPPDVPDTHLPAVVYRCIEYLRGKNAASEEGVFRLSGSNVVVRALKERFNTEGDVNFLEGDHYYDVHAVASLLKLYLRELPTTVLTRELHLDFLHVLELDEKSKKIAAFNTLVHKLPQANWSLLKALSEFLIIVVNNSNVNKMTVRNVGIVFSPTLNIPAPVFSMFLTDFDSIFGAEVSDITTKTVEITIEKPVAADDIRSPRHQMFSELPTPAYNQISFPLPMGQADNRPSGAYDTGFIPMQPSYEPRAYGAVPYNPGKSEAMPSGEPQYGSMNRMLAPSNAPSAKAKRRESSMLFMGTSNRKSSVPRMREDHSMVNEESLF